MDRPTEEEVGISEFLHPAVTGFTGRFKSRWQDFHVHEVDTTGVELHLSMLLTPGMVAAEIKKASDAKLVQPWVLRTIRKPTWRQY